MDALVILFQKTPACDNANIQNSVSVYDNISLEKDVVPSMVFTNVFNPHSAVSR